MDKTTNNRTVAGGGIGGALGVIVVVMLPKLTTLTWSAEEASMMTAALGVLFGWLVRFLPKPA
jgi:hypothetical protein